jgi:hypothetical protein
MTGVRSGLAQGGPLGFSDAAKRFSDGMALHCAAGSYGRWMAVRLSDGGTDGIPYELLADAMRHQLHPTQCLYVRVALAPIPPQEADAVLGYYRRAYDHGWRPDECWAEALAQEGFR